MKLDYFKNALKKKYEQKHCQQLQCALSKPQDFINFASHDSLGLSTHPYVQEKTVEAIMRWGSGSTLSRPLFDHLSAHADLEARFCALLKSEQAVLFPCAFNAQKALFKTLSKTGATFYIERSYPLQSIKRHIKSTIHQFDHANFTCLPDGREPKIILAPAVCPKPGTILDIRCLLAHAAKSDALLIIDDTYALGVLGPQGMGLAASRGIDITIGSFGKTSGSFGAYIATSSLLREFIDQSAPTAPLPPATLGALDAALDLIPDMDAERRSILNQAAAIRRRLSLSHTVIENRSHIVAIKDAHTLSDKLADQGIIAMPTDLPSLTLNIGVQHTPAVIKALYAALDAEPALVR